jgi:uncharacterized protein YmfQ (DUF2313 family)
MALLSCPSGPQPDWCPRTTDDALPAVLGSTARPRLGWREDRGHGSNTYWRAFANVLGFTYGRLCDFVDEFFCATVKESLDQWIEEYGLDDECDPYGHNLCLKVAAQGGATCDYFVQMAALSGLGYHVPRHVEIPSPSLAASKSAVRLSARRPYLGDRLASATAGGRNCDYGEVVNHPDPAMWENGKTAGAVCKVPGSNLGNGPDTDESCCFIVGFYEVAEDPAVETPDYCHFGTKLTFDCPQSNRPTMNVAGCDSTGFFVEYGNAYVWEVTVDIAASQTLQNTILLPTIDVDETISAAGNFMVGGEDCGTPLCAAVDVPSIVLCFLDRIKPAHTTLVTHLNIPAAVSSDDDLYSAWAAAA